MSKVIKYSKNPFSRETLQDLSDKVYNKRSFVKGTGKTAASIVSPDGEVIGGTALVTFKQVDSSQFAKLYIDKLKKWSGMRGAATQVFEYLLRNLPINSDMVYLDMQDAEKMGIARASYFRGLAWLLNNQFLAKSVRTNWYYINATIFFNGDRLVLIDIYKRDLGISDKKPNNRLLNSWNNTNEDQENK